MQLSLVLCKNSIAGCSQPYSSTSTQILRKKFLYAPRYEPMTFLAQRFASVSSITFGSQFSGGPSEGHQNCQSGYQLHDQEPMNAVELLFSLQSWATRTTSSDKPNILTSWGLLSPDVKFAPLTQEPRVGFSVFPKKLFWFSQDLSTALVRGKWIKV